MNDRLMRVSLLAVALLLVLTALGDALVMFVVSAALLVGMMLLRTVRQQRWSAMVACLVAVVVAASLMLF